MNKKEEPQHTLVIRDRDLKGRVTGERTIVAHSMDDAFKLASIRRVTFDGHVGRDVLRTEAGVEVKTFCGLLLVVEVGVDGSPERESYTSRSKVPVDCWKCRDRAPP